MTAHHSLVHCPRPKTNFFGDYFQYHTFAHFTESGCHQMRSGGEALFLGDCAHRSGFQASVHLQQTEIHRQSLRNIICMGPNILPLPRPFLVFACHWQSSWGRGQLMLLRWSWQRERRRDCRSGYERHWSEMLTTNGNFIIYANFSWVNGHYWVYVPI